MVSVTCVSWQDNMPLNCLDVVFPYYLEIAEFFRLNRVYLGSFEVLVIWYLQHIFQISYSSLDYL